MSYNYLILRVLDRPNLDFACVGSLNLEGTGTGTGTGTGIGLRPAACRQTETAPALRASAVSVCLQRNVGVHSVMPKSDGAGTVQSNTRKIKYLAIQHTQNQIFSDPTHAKSRKYSDPTHAKSNI